MKYIVLLLLAFPAHADVYMDIAAEVHNKAYDSFRQHGSAPIKNFIGMVEVGYEFDKNKSIFIRHMSSVEQADTGLNTIGIKFRIW